MKICSLFLFFYFLFFFSFAFLVWKFDVLFVGLVGVVCFFLRVTVNRRGRYYY